MAQPILIAPSLLSANLASVLEDVKICEGAQAEVLHIDVMDGSFVPPITFGANMVTALRNHTAMILDCHLMVQNPDAQIEQFAAAGANWISVHAEACNHLHRTVSRIQQLGCKAGVVLNPATPLEFAMEVADTVDFILLMSVNPGYGGQNFIPSFITRCKRLRTWLNENNLAHVFIQVDGGVKLSNCKDIAKAGASVLVSGSGLFTGNLERNIREMRLSLTDL